MRNPASFICRGYIGLIQDEKELRYVFADILDKTGLDLGDRGIDRKHDNPCVYMLHVALSAPGVVGFRRSNTRRLDKDAPGLKERRRIGYFHRGNLLAVAGIARFRDV